MGQRPYGLHPGHRHVPPRFPLREIGGTDMGTLAINKGRHSAKAGNWRKAKEREGQAFSHPATPLRQPTEMAGWGPNPEKKCKV